MGKNNEEKRWWHKTAKEGAALLYRRSKCTHHDGVSPKSTEPITFTDTRPQMLLWQHNPIILVHILGLRVRFDGMSNVIGLALLFVLALASLAQRKILHVCRIAGAILGHNSPFGVCNRLVQ